MGNQIIFHKDARERIKNGIDIIVNAVKVTLGPRGRNVIIDREDQVPKSTKDGVSIADEIQLDDKLENMGAKMVKEVAGKSLQLAGDGTTTSSVLIQRFINNIFRLPDNVNIYKVKAGINIALKYIKMHLEKISTTVTTEDIDAMTDIATISLNGDKQLGRIIAKCYNQVGRNGTVEFVEGDQKTFYDINKGMSYTDVGKFTHNHTKDLQGSFDNPYILIVDGSVEQPEDYMGILDIVLKNNRPLVILCKGVSVNVLAHLHANRSEGTMIGISSVPGHGKVASDYLYDISIATGATIIGEDYGNSLTDVTESDLGSSNFVLIIEGKVLNIGEFHGDQDKILDHINHLRKLKEEAPDSYSLDIFSNRLAKLSGGVATITVGAPTETERKEKFDRVDDAVKAVASALDEGIVPGGNVALISCIPGLTSITVNEVTDPDVIRGIEVISDALDYPLYTMLRNSGLTEDEAKALTEQVLEEIPEHPNHGIDVNKGDFTDLVARGIVDPKRVTRTAVENAVSMAKMFLMTDCAIYND